MSTPTTSVVTPHEPLPLAGIKALIVQLEGQKAWWHDGPSGDGSPENYAHYRAIEDELDERLFVLREQLKNMPRKRRRCEGVKTSFYDGKWKKEKRKGLIEDAYFVGTGHEWKKIMSKRKAALYRFYRLLSLRCMTGDSLSRGEESLLDTARESVDEQDREKDDGRNPSDETGAALGQSVWTRWVLSPRGPYSREIARLVRQSAEGREVLSPLGDRSSGDVVRVADHSQGNLVKCVCSWPNCPWLTHTLGSEEQKSCAWLSANAERYGLVTSRDPDLPEIREWLATPDAAVRAMSLKHADRVMRVRREGEVDVNRSDVRAKYDEKKIHSDVVKGGDDVWVFEDVQDLSWQNLDVVSNVGWRRVLYGRAARSEREAADAAEEEAAAEALESALLAGNTFNPHVNVYV